MTTTQVMSDLEQVVFDFLTKRNIAFDFQTSLAGGLFALGGAVVDFIVEPNLAWRIMGEYYHRGIEKTGSDTIQKEMLSALGYVVVDIWADDIENRLDETLTLALQGQEMIR